MKKEDCEGCVILDKNRDCPWFVESLTCPCLICLIKMMCMVACDSLKKYIRNSYNERLRKFGGKIMSNIMDKLCNGCLVYERFKESAKNNIMCVGYIIKDTECPCQHCLIKMMCCRSCNELDMRKWPILSELKTDGKYKNE